MYFIGFILIFAIPSVWLKPTINKSEAIISRTNDTAARAKRQKEFFDFLHQLINQHANCAEQKLTPLEPFGSYKPYETFIYPNEFAQPRQQSVRVPSPPIYTQFNMHPMQQQYSNLGSRYDPDIQTYKSNTRELISNNGNRGKLSYNTNTFKKLPVYGSNRFRYRNQPGKFRPQYPPPQLYQRDRKIYNTGLQKQNCTNSVNATKIIEKEITKAVYNKTIDYKTNTARNFENVLTSYPLSTTQMPITQNCTCSNIATPQQNSTKTANSTYNLEYNLNLLIQELESIKKSKNSTDNNEILKILLKLKALKSSYSNTTSQSLELLTNTTEDVQEIYTKLTTLQPSLYKQESTIVQTTENVQTLGNAFEELQTQDPKMNNFKNSTLNSSEEYFKLLNIQNVSNSKEETAVKDSSIDVEQNLNDIVAIDGAPALELNITNAKDLERLTHEMQNLINELQHKANSKEDPSKMNELNDFENFLILNALSDEESIDDNQSLKALKENNKNPTKQQFQNTTASDTILNKTSLMQFQPSGKSSFTATTINVPFKYNGKFKKISVEKQSSKSSNKYIEISEKENTNMALDTSIKRNQPKDMIGIGNRFINFSRKPKVSSDASYVEPIVSEIYPVKANTWKSKSPLNIYVHKIEEKSQNSNNKPSAKWKPNIPDDYNDAEDVSINISKECEDDFLSEETQQQNADLKPSFPELFNYDTNFT